MYLNICVGTLAKKLEPINLNHQSEKSFVPVNAILFWTI